MIDDLAEVLPETLSDEAAFELVTLFEALSYLLEARYYEQMQRHIKNNVLPIDDPPF